MTIDHLLSKKEVFEYIHSNLDVIMEEDSVKITPLQEFGFEFMRDYSYHLEKYINDIRAKGRNLHLDLSKIDNLGKGVLSAYYMACSKKANKEDSKLLISGITKNQEQWLRHTVGENAEFEVFDYKEPQLDIPKPDQELKQGSKKPRKKRKSKKLIIGGLAAIISGIAGLMCLSKPSSRYYTRDNPPPHWVIGYTFEGDETVITKNQFYEVKGQPEVEYIFPGLLSSEYYPLSNLRLLRIAKYEGRGNHTGYILIPFPKEFNELKDKLNYFRTKAKKASSIEDWQTLHDELLQYQSEFKGISPGLSEFQSLSPKDREYIVRATNREFYSTVQDLLIKSKESLEYFEIK